MTIAAYQTLYQSSVTFAMRKQLQAEHGKADLEKTIEQLEAKKTKLENKVQELKSKIEAIEKRNKERKEVEQKKREQEVEFLKYQEGHLAKFLKAVTEKAKASWSETNYIANLIRSIYILNMAKEKERSTFKF